MEHLHFLLLILPAMTCLNWAIFHSVYAFRTDTHRIVVSLMLTCFAVLMVDALFDAPGISMQTVAWSNLLAQLTAPSIIPLTILYIVKLRMKNLDIVLQTIWILAPIALFTGGTLLYSLSSESEIEAILHSTYEYGWFHFGAFKGTLAYTYYLWTVIIFRGILTLEAVMLIGYVVYLIRKGNLSLKRLYNFLFRKGSTSVLELQLVIVILNLLLCPLKLFPMKRYVDAHPGIVIALDLSLVTVLALFGMIALLGAKKEVTLKDVFNCLLYNYGQKTKAEYFRFRSKSLLEQADLETRRYIRARLDEMEKELEPAAETANKEETGPTISEELFATTPHTWTQDSLQAEFEQLMTREQLFRNPKLRLDDIAAKLHTNKTYVSRMVNQCYNIGFSELINLMRIDFAEQYIIKHRAAKQSEIAEVSGFISASAFNNIFKKMTGMTPKAWISNWDRANETL